MHHLMKLSVSLMRKKKMPRSLKRKQAPRRKSLKGSWRNMPEVFVPSSTLPPTSDMSGVSKGSGTSDSRYLDKTYIEATEASKSMIAPLYNKGPLQVVTRPQDVAESRRR